MDDNENEKEGMSTGKKVVAGAAVGVAVPAAVGVAKKLLGNGDDEADRTQVSELRPRPILAGDATRQLVVEAVGRQRQREEQPQSQRFVQRNDAVSSDGELVERKVRQLVLERKQSDEGAALQPGEAVEDRWSLDHDQSAARARDQSRAFIGRRRGPRVSAARARAARASAS